MAHSMDFPFIAQGIRSGRIVEIELALSFTHQVTWASVSSSLKWIVISSIPFPVIMKSK